MSGLFLSLLLIQSWRMRIWPFGTLWNQDLGLGVRQPLIAMCTQKQSLGKQAVTQPAKD